MKIESRRNVLINAPAPKLSWGQRVSSQFHPALPSRRRRGWRCKNIQMSSGCKEVGQSQSERATFGEVWKDGVSTHLRRRWIKTFGQKCKNASGKVNFISL